MTRSFIPPNERPIQAHPSDLSVKDEGGWFSSVTQLWRSPWATWVGLRYLKSKKNSKFLSFITVISIMGISLGVTAMLVVLSVMDGFEHELKKRLMSSEVHILISPNPSVTGFNMGLVPKDSLQKSPIEKALDEDPRVANHWSVISTEAMLKTGRQVTGLVVKGVDVGRIQQLRNQVVESADPQLLIKREGEGTVRLPGLYVGKELAYEMGMIPGDEVTLISPVETDGPMGTVPRLKKFVIEGVYQTGLLEQELHTAYAADSSVRAFLRKAEVVSQWEVVAHRFDDSPLIAQELRKLSGASDYRIQDWVQLNSHLFASLKLERLSMFIFLAFIIVVASFNIVTTLTLMVLEKKREISILKAMGARQSQVGAIFLSEGMIIGVLGIFSGVILGFLICSLLKRYEFIKLPDVYYDRTLPVTFDPMYYFLVPVCALVIVITACLYPSRRAALINPLDGIRFG